MNEGKISIFRLVLGGFSALVVAMGVGRFAYTPLLPEMQLQFFLSNDVAGSIASIKYIGYLMGALLCFKNLTPKEKIVAFRLSLAGSVLTTFSMGFSTQAAWWMVLRFLSGVSSAGIFILSSTIVMEKLQGLKYSHLGILIYSGVGAGIALSGIVSLFLIEHFDIQMAWVGLALICIPFEMLCWFVMIPEPLSENAPHKSQSF